MGSTTRRVAGLTDSGGMSAGDTSRPPIAASQEASSREPVGAAEVQSHEATRHQPGERLTPTKSNRRLIIMVSAVVLALGVAVSLWYGVFAIGTPAPSLAPKISAAEALGKADEAWYRRDYAEATYWYRRAADQGNSQPQNNIGWLYANGEGVSRDPGQARERMQKAAANGMNL
jgi:Sel1 repeat